jgi:hypothetical protein
MSTGTPPPLVNESITVQRLNCRLSPLSSKWQSLGKALSLDEARLDEIFTNNETDEACLVEMLKLYMMRSGRNHSWEEIEAAEEKVRKELLKEQAETTDNISPGEYSILILSPIPIFSGIGLGRRLEYRLRV